MFPTDLLVHPEKMFDFFRKMGPAGIEGMASAHVVEMKKNATETRKKQAEALAIAPKKRLLYPLIELSELFDW